jgi:hypothetical protein
MLSIRRGQKLQRHFEGMDFNVTKVLFEGAPLSMEPSVYLDETSRRWAVRMPGSAPRVFDYGDVLACEVAEVQPPAEEAGGQRLRSLLVNPTRSARANAAKRGYCLGMGVVVAVRAPEAAGGTARLQLPVLTREVKRTSPIYQRMLQYAQQLKDTFDAMTEPAPAYD